MRSYFLVLCAALGSAKAHMSIWHPSVYGMNTLLENPLGPGLTVRSPSNLTKIGPTARADLPTAVMNLPAGGTVTFEIACQKTWTSYGTDPSTPGTQYDACPNNAGPYHADPASAVVYPDLVQGCALGIADVDDINDVTYDDITIFSVNHSCVTTKMTDFQIPAKMPACTGSKCICGWFWEPMTGEGNFYMTGFDCVITNVSTDALTIDTPLPATWCNPTQATADRECTPGAKQPIYLYNDYNNLKESIALIPGGQYYLNRPGYNGNWSFPIDGAQNDIFTDQPAQLSTLEAFATLSALPSELPEGVLPSSLLPQNNVRPRNMAYPTDHHKKSKKRNEGKSGKSGKMQKRRRSKVIKQNHAAL